MKQAPRGIIKEGNAGMKSKQISGMSGKSGDAKSASKAANTTIAQAMGKQMKQDGTPWNKGVFTKPLPPVKDIMKINE